MVDLSTILLLNLDLHHFSFTFGQLLDDLVFIYKVNKGEVAIFVSLVIICMHEARMFTTSNIRARAGLETFKVSSSLLMFNVSKGGLTSRAAGNSSLDTQLRINARVLALNLLLLDLLKLPRRRTGRSGGSSSGGCMVRDAAP